MGRTSIAVTLGAFIALTACGKGGASKANKSGRSLSVKIGDKTGAQKPSQASAVPTFDPNADLDLDEDNYGGGHPDEYAIQQAFYAQFEAMDTCVAEEKKRRKSDEQLQGMVKVSVKLNPFEHRPFGVNAEMPAKYKKAKELSECVRKAAADAKYPRYDGVPRVAEFEFELDPGTVEED